MEVPRNQPNVEQFLPIRIFKETKKIQEGGDDLLSTVAKTWNKIFLVSSDKSVSSVKKISKEIINGLALASPAEKGQPHILLPLYLSLQKRPDFFYVNLEGAERLLRNTKLPYLLRPSSQSNSFSLTALTSKGELKHIRISQNDSGEFFCPHDESPTLFESIDKFLTQQLDLSPIQSTDLEKIKPKKGELFEEISQRNDFTTMENEEILKYLNDNNINYIIRSSSTEGSVTVILSSGKAWRINIDETKKLFTTSIDGKEDETTDSIDTLLEKIGAFRTNRNEETDPHEIRRRLNKNRGFATHANQPPTVGLHGSYSAGKIVYTVKPGETWDKTSYATVNKITEKTSKGTIVDLPEVGIAHLQGKRDYQEDRHIAGKFNINIQGRLEEVKLAGICDGHGGDVCSSFVAKNLQRKLAELLPAYLEKYKEQGEEVAIFNALKIAFVDLHDEYSTKFQGAGTTVCSLMSFHGHLWIANVGDSRAVLCQNGKVLDLTEDASIAVPRYRKAIEKRGGLILEGMNRWGLEGIEPARVIGDAKNRGVDPRPKITDLTQEEIQMIVDQKGEAELVIACDGLWDVASSKQVATTLHRHKGQLSDKAEFLVKKAFASGSGDNISAEVINLKQFMSS